VIEPHVPRWPLTAHVPSEPESASLLPFIINELGIVRETRGRRPSRSRLRRRRVHNSFGRRRRIAPLGASGRARVRRSGRDGRVRRTRLVRGRYSQQASKATLEAYQSQLEHRKPVESIELLLVCNDVRMMDEHDSLDGSYGNRENLPFEIDSKFGVGSEQLAALLTDGGYDFFHYIGHATEDGLRCPDGDLDIRTLESVDLGVFFLNACRSYEQGLALTRRGAFGGVSTYADVINEDAVTAGETIARLLNRGFPLRGRSKSLETTPCSESSISSSATVRRISPSRTAVRRCSSQSTLATGTDTISPPNRTRRRSSNWEPRRPRLSIRCPTVTSPEPHAAVAGRDDGASGIPHLDGVTGRRRRRVTLERRHRNVTTKLRTRVFTTADSIRFSFWSRRNGSKRLSPDIRVPLGTCFPLQPTLPD